MPDASRGAANYTTTDMYIFAGYGQTTGDGTTAGPYTAIRDYWTVPKVNTTHPGKQDSSEWVGIDGISSKDDNLVQDGTAADNVDGKAEYYAWTEIIPGKGEDKISGLTIKPGDRIEGLVQETSKNHWQMTVYDLTTGKSGGRTVTHKALQASAEAILERPCIRDSGCSGSKGLATLAQTTDVTFGPGSYSTATYTPRWTPLLTAAPGATLYQEVMRNNANTATIASPSAPSPDNDSFTVADGATAPPAPWATPGAPLPANASPDEDSGLSSVACQPAAACTAVGYYVDSSNSGQGLLETGSGTSWTATQAPLPAGTDAGTGGALAAVSCGSPSACTAVGYYRDASGDEDGLLLTGSGTSWTAAKAPLPGQAAGAADAALTGVSCGSPSSCTAIGYYIDSSGVQQGILVSGSGTSWKAVQAPVPANAVSSLGTFLSSVDCPSASACTVTGNYGDQSQIQQGLLETGSGKSWTATEAPLPANGDRMGGQDLAAGSCATPTSCTAVGYYVDSSGNEQGLLETGSGTSWTATEAPVPPNTSSPPNAGLNAVTCPTPSSCVAGGSYGDAAENEQGLLETGSGTSWTPDETPTPSAPASGSFSNVLSVACPEASSCAAAGYYTDFADTEQGLLAMGDETSWTATGTVLPADAASNDVSMDAIACLSPANCTATGAYLTRGGEGATQRALIATGPS